MRMKGGDLRAASTYRANRRARLKIIADAKREIARIRETVAQELKPPTQDEGTKA